MKKSSYTIYTDGGCEDLYLGGYGAVIIDNKTGETLELYGGEEATTNNRMEITAVIVALSRVEQRAVVDLYADSQYVLRTIDGVYKKKKNLDLWDKLDAVMKGKTIVTHWVKGHSGNKYNEQCDEMCRLGMAKPDGVTRELRPMTTSKKTDFKKEVEKKKSELPKEGKYLISSGSSMHTMYEFPEEFMYYQGPKRKLNDIGEISVEFLNRVEKPSFKDYSKAKTGGTDGWSECKRAEDIASPEIVEAVAEIFDGNMTDTGSALRWWGRGLTLDKAVRKALVDKEINENYIKSKKRH